MLTIAYTITSGPNQPHVVTYKGKVIAIVPTYRQARAAVRRAEKAEQAEQVSM